MSESPEGFDLPARIEALERRSRELEAQCEELGRGLVRSVASARALGWVAGLALAAAVIGPVVTLGVASGAGGLRSSGGPVVVENDEFLFRGRHDSTRVMLFADKYAAPHVALLDPAKNIRMFVKVWPDGASGVQCFGSSGVKAELKVDADGAAGLDLGGGSREGAISLRVGADGSPRLIMKDPSGKVVFEAPAASPPPPTP